MKRLLVSILFCHCTTALSATLFAHIDFVEGTASIINPKGEARIAHPSDVIYEGETIVTGRDGELHAITDDHGIVAIRPNTKMKVDAYSAHADDTDRTALSLLVGGLRIISGWIGKYHAKNYAVHTPTATIGIRGTDHETFVIPEPILGEQSIGTPGTYEKVNSGLTVLQNASGQVLVHPDQAAFAGMDEKRMPQLLEHIPAFYHASRNEGRIEERKAKMERELAERHEERLRHHTRQEPRESMPRK